MKKLILYTCCSATQYYNCHTILKCKFDFVNSKWKKSLVWENPVNSNICVRENKCISLSPSTRLNRHHIPRFGLIRLVSIFTGHQASPPIFGGPMFMGTCDRYDSVEAPVTRD